MDNPFDYPKWATQKQQILSNKNLNKPSLITVLIKKNDDNKDAIEID